MEDIIKEFIEWAHVESPDAWWIFEHPDEAIKKYMQHVKVQDN